MQNIRAIAVRQADNPSFRFVIAICPTAPDFLKIVLEQSAKAAGNLATSIRWKFEEFTNRMTKQGELK